MGVVLGFGAGGESRPHIGRSPARCRRADFKSRLSRDGVDAFSAVPRAGKAGTGQIVSLMENG